jgi:thioredoxin-related protein
MRKLIIITIICLGTLSWNVLLAQGINFETITMQEAINKASDPVVQKLILVDCYTTWCIPCIEMASYEFPKKVAGDYFNPKFVSVKFDMEKGEGKELAKKYNVKAYPTFLILDAKGQEINRIVGKSNADEFIEKVKAALDPKNSLPGYKAAYEAQKDLRTGLPYALALYQNSKDPVPVLNELFDNAQDFERFSRAYLEVALGTTKFGTPFFRKLMMEKSSIDQALGTEVTNKILFDKVRKDMYSIATETGARYQVFYTAQEVEDVAYTIGLLKLPQDNAESHMCRIALFVVNKDINGMISYFKRRIAALPSGTPFKGILEGILMQNLAKASPEQKVAIMSYFEDRAKSLAREAKSYQEKVTGTTK